MKKETEPIWVTKDGRKIPVKDLEYSHLLAIHRILIAQTENLEDSDEFWDNPRLYKNNLGNLGAWKKIISQEIRRRKNG